jgi:hypothetical protein
VNKNIAFHRNLYLSWLDAAAALAGEQPDRARVRAALDTIVAERIESTKARNMTLDMLMNIWVKTGDQHPALYAEALTLFTRSEVIADRLWLHYGLTLLTYSFFRLSAAIIGQISRLADDITSRDLKTRLTAELGQIGALDTAAERVVFSLRNWGILTESGQRNVYVPQRQHFTASQPTVERWLLAAALTAHPAQELPFTDLVRLPELFPFRFTIGVDALRQDSRFEVHRQGLGWDMVQLIPERPGTPQLSFDLQSYQS